MLCQLKNNCGNNSILKSGRFSSDSFNDVFPVWKSKCKMKQRQKISNMNVVLCHSLNVTISGCQTLCISVCLNFWMSHFSDLPNFLDVKLSGHQKYSECQIFRQQKQMSKQALVCLRRLKCWASMLVPIMKNSLH